MFKVGDKVRVKAGVNEPRHAWGRVKPGDIGTIIAFGFREGAATFFVDFPAQACWHAYAPEMELVEEPVAKKLYTVKDIKGTRAYQQLKDSAENTVVLGMLVKRFLNNINNMPIYGGKEEDRFLALNRCFSWPRSAEGNKFWADISAKKITTLAHLQAFNKPKAKKVKPKLEPMPIAPPPPAPAIGRGERPADATHWCDYVGKWLKVDKNGVVSFWKNDQYWREYLNQNLGKNRLEISVPLAEEIIGVQLVKARPKAAVPEQPVVKKAPRIGWWG